MSNNNASEYSKPGDMSSKLSLSLDDIIKSHKQGNRNKRSNILIILDNFEKNDRKPQNARRHQYSNSFTRDRDYQDRKVKILTMKIKLFFSCYQKVIKFSFTKGL